MVSQGGSGTYGVGWMRRRGRVTDGLPHRSPDAARNATGTGDLTWHDLRRPLKSPNHNRFAYPSQSRPEGVEGPSGSIWRHRPRRLVIEIRQIWGSVIRPVSSLRPRQCGPAHGCVRRAGPRRGGGGGSVPRCRQDPAQGVWQISNYQLKHSEATCRTRFSS